MQNDGAGWRVSGDVIRKRRRRKNNNKRNEIKEMAEMRLILKVDSGVPSPSAPCLFRLNAITVMVSKSIFPPTTSGFYLLNIMNTIF